METELEFPQIMTGDDVFDGEPASVPGELRTAAGVLKQMAPQTMQTSVSEIAKTDIKKVALSRFGDWKPTAEALVKKFDGVVFADTDTTKGYAALTSAIAEVRAPRYKAKNVSDDSKSELAQVSKAIGAELGVIVAYLKPTEDALVAQKESADAAKAAKEAEAARIEALALAEHLARVDNLTGCVEKARGKTSEQIAKGAAIIEALVIDPAKWGRAEWVAQGEKAKSETLSALRHLETQAKRQEAEAAERAQVEAQRIENARVAAELAERKRQMDAEDEARRVQAAREKYELAEQEQRQQAALAEHAAQIEREQRDRQEDENKTIESIWYHARRIEGNRVGYVQKAIGYFESGPGTYADDPRQNVAAAVQQARAEMQEKLRLAGEREREEHEAEALARAEREQAEQRTSLQHIGEMYDSASAILEQGGNAPVAPPGPAQILSDVLRNVIAVGDCAPTTGYAAQGIGWKMENAGPSPTQALALHALDAFNTHFPKQPKPSVEWWAELRRLATEVAA